MGSVSPELALVDPTLRALVQAELPLPPDCLAPRPQAPEAVRTATRARAVRGWTRPSLVVVVASLLLAAIIGSPFVEMVVSNASPEAIFAAEAPTRPGPGAGPAPSHEISWPAVPGARFYVVSIVDAGGEVATLHRATNHVTLRVGTVLRDGIVIRAGAYDWSVAPAFGARAAPRRGNLLAAGHVVLAE